MGSLRRHEEYARNLVNLHETIGVPFDEVYPYVLEARRGDPAATLIVVASSALLIVPLANKYHLVCFKKIEHDDLVAAGVRAVEAAIAKFDREQGAWSTYLTFWLQNYMLREIKLSAELVHIPSHAEKEPRRTVQSLDAPALISDGGTTQGTFADTLRAKQALEHAEVERTDTIHAALAVLKPEERKILALRYGIGGAPMSITEVAHCFDRDRLWVRKTEAQALRKIYQAEQRT